MLPWVAWHDKIADAVGPLARRLRVRSSTSAAAAPQQQQAADRFSELCGYSLPLGRSREMRMHVLAFPNAGTVDPALGDRARFFAGKVGDSISQLGGGRGVKILKPFFPPRGGF